MRRIALLSAVLIVAAFAANAQTNGTLLTCESINNVRHTCKADVATGVTLNRQFSKDICVRGKTWGTTRNNDGIWVDAGCRAEFLVGGGSALLPNGVMQTVTCESIPGHTKRCTAMTANGVVVNAREARWWYHDRFGSACGFEGKSTSLTSGSTSRC